LANILERVDVDTSSEWAAVLGDETGSGACVFGTGPTLNGPVLQTSTVAGLPAAGSRTGAVYLVTDGSGATPCTTGSGTSRVICRDTGATYDTYGGISNVAAGISVDQSECILVPNLSSSSIGAIHAFPIAASVERVACRCRGTCTTAATIQFTDASVVTLPIGSAITCQANVNMTWVDVSGDVDGDLSAGEPLQYDVTNTPSPGTDEYLICATFSRT
jgi:hypothetical protein